MNNLKEQIWIQGRDLATKHMRYLASSTVQYLVGDQVSDQVWDQVNDQVRNRVWDKIWNKINRK